VEALPSPRLTVQWFLSPAWYYTMVSTELNVSVLVFFGGGFGVLTNETPVALTSNTVDT